MRVDFENHIAGTGLRRKISAILRYVVAGTLIVGACRATENGASIYPAGVETIMPGRLPGPGATMLLEFNNSYTANGLLGSNGQNVVPGFHLRVTAVAVKVVHNWGVHALGGMLVSSLALPVVYMHLDGPFGKGNKTGLANPDIGVAAISYNWGALHFWYGSDVCAPGFGYHKNDLVNIGQHNWALAPQGAFTYAPNQGRAELSSKFQYIVNYTNQANKYRSGNEFVWEYAAMRNVTKVIAIGVNGYLYKQTTDDQLNGVRFLDGNRGRDLGIGPELRCRFQHYALIAKFEKDTFVQNRTVGNAFWLQLGIPVSRE